MCREGHFYFFCNTRFKGVIEVKEHGPHSTAELTATQFYMDPVHTVGIGLAEPLLRGLVPFLVQVYQSFEHPFRTNVSTIDDDLLLLSVSVWFF